MVTANIHEAKTHLSKLLKRVAAGEEVIITKAGHPVARILPWSPPERERIPDTEAGRIRIHEDWDDPLPNGMRRAFGT